MAESYPNESTPLVAQIVKNLPSVQETWVRSLGWEDPLEKGMATHSSILAWRIPWTEEPGGLQSRGHKESDTTEQLSQRLRRASGPGRAVLHCSVTRRDGGLAQPCQRRPCHAVGPGTLPCPTRLCSAPGHSAALSRDRSQGFSTVPAQGAALHTIV